MPFVNLQYCVCKQTYAEQTIQEVSKMFINCAIISVFFHNADE